MSKSSLIARHVCGPAEKVNASLGEWLMSNRRAPSNYVAAQGTALGRVGRAYVRSGDDQVWVGGETAIRISGS